MFFVLNKKFWVIGCFCFAFILIVLGFSLFSVKATSNSFTIPEAKYTVVIDAGHGGIDGGCVGSKSKVKESELNLVYAKNLAKRLNEFGFSCVLTRENDDGLYDDSAKSLKKSDMSKRKEIIEKSNPTLVLSIHMNSFSNSSARGAQTFYKKDSECGKMLADCIQTQLNKTVDYAKKTSRVGDYYMVNCTDLPASLIECGYLSNTSEEVLLQKESYQNKICYAIACGVVDFLSNS